MKIGPFFYIQRKILADARDLSAGRLQSGKLDNSVGHDALFDKHFRRGDYINYPRGRVIWDIKEGRAIVYIDPCICRAEVLTELAQVFELEEYRVESDEHYHCRNCIRKLWDEL